MASRLLGSRLLLFSGAVLRTAAYLLHVLYLCCPVRHPAVVGISARFTPAWSRSVIWHSPA